MSDVWNKMISELSNLSGTIAEKSEEYIKIAMEKGTEYSHKGKLQFEIETTRRELKKEQLLFGKFVYEKFDKEDATDFTLNDQFKVHTEKIKNLKKVIRSLKSEKQNVNNKKAKGSASREDENWNENSNISSNEQIDFKL